MALQDKYKELIDYANANGASDLSVVEQDSILYITVTVPGEHIKQELWNLYEKVDPGMKSADLVLNVTATAAGQTYEVKSGDNLSKIASKFEGITWKDIFEANRDKISDPDKIFPGQVLNIPA